MVLIKSKSLTAVHFPSGTSLVDGWNNLEVLPFGDNYAQIQWVFRRLESERPRIGTEISVQIKAAEGEDFFYRTILASSSDDLVVIKTPNPKWMATVGVWITSSCFKLEDVSGITLGPSEDFELKTAAEISIRHLNLHSNSSDEGAFLSLSGDFHLTPKLKIKSGDFYVEQILAYSNAEIESPRTQGELAARERTTFRGEVSFIRSGEMFAKNGTILRLSGGSARYSITAKIEKFRVEAAKFERLRIDLEGVSREQTCL